MRILIVEDDFELSSLLRINLEHQQYDCHQAQTLDQARRSLRECRPDAVILDIGLPDGNGLDLLSALRQKEMQGAAPLPVIVITGSDNNLAFDGKPAVIAWLHKPFNQSALSNAVARALKNK